MRTNLSLFLIVIALSVTACQTDVYQRGKGPITLSPRILTGFEQYKTEDSPSYFAVANDGKGYGYTRCPPYYFEGCEDDIGDKALRLCDQKTKARGSECSIFAVGREIVWDGPVSRLKLSDDYLFFFAKIRPGSRMHYGGKGNVFDGGRMIDLRLGECRGEAILNTKKWYIKGCKKNYSAHGTFVAGSGSEKFYGVGKDNEGNGVEIKLLVPESSDVTISRESVSTSSPVPTSRKGRQHRTIPATVSKSDISKYQAIDADDEKPISGT